MAVNFKFSHTVILFWRALFWFHEKYFAQANMPLNLIRILFYNLNQGLKLLNVYLYL